MAEKVVKITDLTELKEPATDDVTIIVDVSEPLDVNKTKHIKNVNLTRFPRVIMKRVVPSTVLVSAGDAQDYWTVPEELNGHNLINAQAAVDNPSSSGALSLMIHNATDGVDLLSDPIIIEEGEQNSYTAKSQSAVDANHDDLSTGDRIRFDVDEEGTGTKGLEYILTVRQPAA